MQKRSNCRCCKYRTFIHSFVFDKTSGFTTNMYAIVINVVKPASTSVFTFVLCSFKFKKLFQKCAHNSSLKIKKLSPKGRFSSEPTFRLFSPRCSANAPVQLGPARKNSELICTSFFEFYKLYVNDNKIFVVFCQYVFRQYLKFLIQFYIFILFFII